MPTTTLGGLTAEQRVSYNKVLLLRAKPYTPGFHDAKKSRIPTREGQDMEWRIIGGSGAGGGGAAGAPGTGTGVGLALVTNALAEGTPPTETSMFAYKITEQVKQYGAFVKASDLLVHQSIDPIWAEIYALLGEQAGQSFHTLLMNVLAGGTNVQFASTAADRNALTGAMVMTGTEVREAVRTLDRAKAVKFPDGMYHGLMHVDVAFDLRNDPDFKNSQIYNGGQMGGGNSMLTNELRDWMGVRWMVTTDAPAFGLNTNTPPVKTFGTLVYGKDWYGTVDLEAQPMGSVSDTGDSGLKIMAVPVETETKDDPLGQFGTAGWKGTMAGKILQDWRGVRIESSATA